MYDASVKKVGGMSATEHYVGAVGWRALTEFSEMMFFHSFGAFETSMLKVRNQENKMQGGRMLY